MQGPHPLIQDLHTFVEAERDANALQLQQTWLLPLEQKLTKGLTQGFTRLEKAGEPTQLWAYLDEGDSRFREGDMLRLHLGHAISEVLCARMKFEREEDGRWLLSEKLASTIWDQYQSGACYADPDGMDLTHYYVKALEDIAASIQGDNLIVPLLGESPDITFNEADLDHAEKFALDEGCNERQAQAVGLALGAEQVACIQGPPGTGKTRALALIAQLLVARGERVFVTSHTHMAINNALSKIAGRNVPTVKVGGRPEDLDKAVDWVQDPANWKRWPKDGSGYVIGATPFATCSRLENYTFDTVIFDEASQITLPLALMAMRKAKRFIFIGDQKQLPPVMLSRSILSDESMSIFGRLTSQDADHTVMLEDTYRMNQWLTEWPSKAYYGNRLRAAGSNKLRRFQSCDLNGPLAQVFDPDACAVFIPTADSGAKNRNFRDAERVVQLCQTAKAQGLSLHEIGIVSPYRAQGRAIRNLLIKCFGRDAAKMVVADTVERMQGQERELIILSLASGDEVFIGAVAEFFFQPERLNVSITRAMTKLIIIGPELAQGIVCSSDTTQQWAEQYRHLISQCRKVVFEI
ncbi:DNA helicase [Pseudomonas sp. FW306-02-F02-AA]|uniref:DNA helicase n=1 Tax=Pseudomonas fluorescens TaxID=294 RepID=A0A0N9VZN0_PSEFL|nr:MULTISPECIES: AAA domain-containing protein [Pseudomonas]ALH99551.1 DNA helicase [Pseudomonas fluorescens]PMZ04647.1 DNA helicase [Pseudomonas sp. FW306-02-F02-AB]PMZ07449.1 DNA helicase [Pseudomonas sp. FW306-02-H06C]PMZ16629.1 DNA helicase [Pseudomonas sp. FW306-02-F02-AA]PMZ19031.1 DNA helicase [Pseudomonas sp. FW306-02-F08-AA]